MRHELLIYAAFLVKASKELTTILAAKSKQFYFLIVIGYSTFVLCRRCGLVAECRVASWLLLFISQATSDFTIGYTSRCTKYVLVVVTTVRDFVILPSVLSAKHDVCIPARILRLDADTSRTGTTDDYQHLL